jgi:hypothetical protein
MKTMISPILFDPLEEDTRSTDRADFFLDKMNGLYLLAFLVTADRQVADMCFSKALDEYVAFSGGFIDWARQKGRRAVLDHAVRIIRPVPKQAYSWDYPSYERRVTTAAFEPFAAITSLNAFERFVFVMSVIECLPDGECAVLLNCRAEDVAIGRKLAREIIHEEDVNFDLTGEMELFSDPSLSVYQDCGIC